MKTMSAAEFADKVKALADKSDMDKKDKKNYSLFIAYACYTDKNKSLICEYLRKDGITFRSLIDYVASILPPVEITEE